MLAYVWRRTRDAETSASGFCPPHAGEDSALTAGPATEIPAASSAHSACRAIDPHQAAPYTAGLSERVAQVVEHVTFNHGVEGSSPSALTKQNQALMAFTAIWRKA